MDVGKVMPPKLATVTASAPFPILGVVVEAVMLANPELLAVTRTEALLLFAGMMTLAGTVTMPVLLDNRFTVMAVGDADGSVT